MSIKAKIEGKSYDEKKRVVSYEVAQATKPHIPIKYKHVHDNGDEFDIEIRRVEFNNERGLLVFPDIKVKYKDKDIILDLPYEYCNHPYGLGEDNEDCLGAVKRMVGLTVSHMHGRGY
jgi:hypothetical protein